ncbi:hypothetical protein BKA18_000769 [Streptomyces auratus]
MSARGAGEEEPVGRVPLSGLSGGMSWSLVRDLNVRAQCGRCRGEETGAVAHR